MGEAWSSRRITVRLRDFLVRVPKFAAGTRTVSLEGLAGYAYDSAIVQDVARTVVSALVTPSPHPVFGDDGHQEEMRERALEVLVWAEAWVAWRDTNGWTSSGRRLSIGDTIPDSTC